MIARDDMHAEAQSWIAAVEAAAAEKAGAPLEGLAAEVAQAVGIMCMFAARARAKGPPSALHADEFLAEQTKRMAPLLNLTTQELRELRPVGVA